MPPPTRADRPAIRPQTAKQMSAATTVMTTWPSTTLPASRLAWGNSRVTTTLLLQVDNPCEHNYGPARAAGLSQRCSKIVWLGNDLRVPWPGARIIYADPRRLNTKPEKTIFPGVFYVFGAARRGSPRIPRARSGSHHAPKTRAGRICPARQIAGRRRRPTQSSSTTSSPTPSSRHRSAGRFSLPMSRASSLLASLATFGRGISHPAVSGAFFIGALRGSRRPQAGDAAVVLAHGRGGRRAAARTVLRVDRARGAVARDRDFDCCRASRSAVRSDPTPRFSMEAAPPPIAAASMCPCRRPAPTLR